MRTRRYWFLVTAGHVLDEIEEERRSGIQIDSFRLWDGWSTEAVDRHFVPFAFDDAPKYCLRGEGLDYGLIQLRENYVDLISANGVVAIGEEHFQKTWPDEFEAYVMIGTAANTVSLEACGDRSTMLTQTTYVIHLEKVTDIPDELRTSNPRFCGRLLISESSPMWSAIGQNIRGMSGGPVLGIRRGREGMAYWIVGVQSGWLPSRRIIAACDFQSFARHIAAAIEQQDNV
ncbi:MAG: hypothetical protein HS101_00075 [Planctomycetia bacterium]|nr:hypothetical protein [Planctomycetia bacterium]MCC7315337.1 hypothetical protein [Planctomycetota bacterium]